MRRMAVSLALLVASAAGAHAMMPPGVYQKARETAPLHVQVEIITVAVPSPTPGGCKVVGKVMRIFRDTAGTMSTGRLIDFPVECRRANEVTTVGGAIYQDADALSAARYMEVYLEGEEKAFTVPLDQSRIIDAPSDTPQFPVQ